MGVYGLNLVQRWVLGYFNDVPLGFDYTNTTAGVTIVTNALFTESMDVLQTEDGRDLILE